MSYKGYEPVIGLEIHAQLKTQSKMFCSDSTAFDAGDNENTSPVSTGMPGTLPVVNKKAIEYSILTGVALNCEIRNTSIFARKNYFYPDLPKGYQISQYEEPICENGYVEFYLNKEKRKIGITRAHMEEDAGKSTHHGDYTLINFNRSGMPLLEIVSEPDIRSAAEAAEYARVIRSILRYIDVCDGNLEEGSMRCDCNISVRKVGAEKFGTKVEVKNVNSFRFVEKAIEFEIQRQIDCLESGETIHQETRLYDSTKNKTFSMRMKENSDDYRYFPDPDLLPVHFEDKLIEDLKKTLPELPLAKAQRFQKEYGLPEYDATLLTQEKEHASFFEESVGICKNAKSVSNWMMGEFLAKLKDEKMEMNKSPITPNRLGEMIRLIDDGTISGKIAKKVFSEMWTSNLEPKKIIEEKGWVQVLDSSSIEKWIDEVLEGNPKEVELYRGGKEKLFGFFVGQIMKASKGQANPGLVNEKLKEKLKG